MRVAGELLGASVYELAPGERTWPYHYHHGNEEWLVVLEGRATLRTPDGEHPMRGGQIVCLPEGQAGAHQVINRSDEPVRVLILSTLNTPSAAAYPDGDKLRVGLAADAGGPLTFRAVDVVDYWEGGE
jgi:uncharacterized cupin superfamily protein